MILIAGSGRNSGKTILACEIIRRFGREVPLMALKISPHRHHIDGGGRLLYEDDRIYLAEELERHSGKDSARMLDAGAARSFFLVAADADLPGALDRILQLTGPHCFFVCESGGLIRYVDPGLFLVTRNGDAEKTLRYRSFHSVEIIFQDNTLYFDIDRISLENRTWKLRET